LRGCDLHRNRESSLFAPAWPETDLRMGRSPDRCV